MLAEREAPRPGRRPHRRRGADRPPRGDPLSYLSVDPTWKPFLADRDDYRGTFTLTDLINFGARADG